MKTLKIFSFIAVMGLLLGGCELVRDYEFDDNPDGLRDRLLLEYFEKSYDPSCTMFCQAVRRAGLVHEVQEAGDRTVIIPNNTAMTALLASMSATSFDQVHPVVLRTLMLYLIFPGDHRAFTMESGESHKVTTLSGDPIWISRNPTSGDKYRMVINNTTQVATSSIVVGAQDYMFKNNVVGQVVATFPIYKPSGIKATDGVPEGFVAPGEVSKATLTSTDDASVYAGGRDTNYPNNSGNGVQIVGRSSNQRAGIYKFTLDRSIDFIDDLVSAKFEAQMHKTTTYAASEVISLNVHLMKLHDRFGVEWDASTVTWNHFQTAASPYDPPSFVIATEPMWGVAHLTLPDGYNASNSVNATYWNNNRTVISADITAGLIKYYATDSTKLALAVLDRSADVANALTEIQLKGFRYQSHRPYIILTGPFESGIQLVRNNPVTLTNGMATFSPDLHFAITGPASNPEGYSYADNNIIYSVKQLPVNGVITLYGVPMTRNQKFTQAEMKAGMVKYLQTGIEPGDEDEDYEEFTGPDTFILSVYDYLGGKYPDQLTITVQ